MVTSTRSRNDSARSLKRYASDPTVPIQTKPVLCIRGGVLRAWMVLPTVELRGRTFAPLSSNMCWLQQLLGGYRRKRLYHAPVACFLQECLAAFRTGEDQQSSNGFEPSDVPANKDEGRVRRDHLQRKVGTAALGISDSEDENAVRDEGFGPREQTSPKLRRVPTARLGELITRDVRGFKLTYTVGRGPKVLIPTDGPFIERIVKDLQPRARERSAGSPARSSASSQEGLAATAASSQDRGRVFWRGLGYQIIYSDGKGNRRQSRAGLTLPKRGLTNEPLTEEETLRAKHMLLKKARREWNRLDQSGAPRFDA